MDPSLIYRKTLDGETSISGRNRLRNQRLRAVLILIDGETPVGTLCAQLGDKFRPQEKISQLEQLGLIEPVDGSPATDESDRYHDALDSAAKAELHFVKPDLDIERDLDPDTVSPSPAAAFTPMSSEPDTEPVPQATSPGCVDDWRNADPNAVLAPAGEHDVEDAPHAWASTPDRSTLDDFQSTPMGGAQLERPSRASWLRRTITRLSARQGKRAVEPAPLSEIPSEPQPRERQPELSRRAPWWKLPSIVLLGMAAAFAWILFTLPWNDYRVQLEVQAAALVGQSVHIADMGLEMLPYPRVVLRNITVGRQPLARIATARLVPSVRSLADLRRLSVHLAVDGLTLEKRAVAAVCASTRLNAKAASQSHLRSVRIADMALVLPVGSVGGLQADISISPEWDRPLVTVKDEAGDLRVALAPEGGGCSFTADSQKWTVPLGSGVALSSLVARGSVDERNMDIAHFDARSADGIIKGSATLDWRQEARLDLKLEFSHLSLEKALAILAAPSVAHGELDGKLHLSARSPRLNGLVHALIGSGAVAVKHGVIEHFNVVEATRSPGRAAVYGGDFSFERLTAQVQLKPHRTTVRNLNITAGAVQAEGEVAVEKQGRLNGTLYANVSSAAQRLRIPVAVSGSLESPELRALVVGARSESDANRPIQTRESAETKQAH